MSEPRFYVREHSGYRFSLPIKERGASTNYVELTEVMVIDRDYCHRVVRSFPPNPGGPSGIDRRRTDAAALCETLNA